MPRTRNRDRGDHLWVEQTLLPRPRRLPYAERNSTHAMDATRRTAHLVCPTLGSHFSALSSAWANVPGGAHVSNRAFRGSAFS
jgi:hypothetical protein